MDDTYYETETPSWDAATENLWEDHQARMRRWRRDSGGRSVKVLAFFVFVAILVAGCGSSEASLSERANEACGNDRIAAFKHDSGGFAAQESIAVTCERPNGSIYIKVVYQ